MADENLLARVREAMSRVATRPHREQKWLPQIQEILDQIKLGEGVCIAENRIRRDINPPELNRAGICAININKMVLFAQTYPNSADTILRGRNEDTFPIDLFRGERMYRFNSAGGKITVTRIRKDPVRLRAVAVKHFDILCRIRDKLKQDPQKSFDTSYKKYLQYPYMHAFALNGIGLILNHEKTAVKAAIIPFNATRVIYRNFRGINNNIRSVMFTDNNQVALLYAPSDGCCRLVHYPSMKKYLRAAFNAIVLDDRQHKPLTEYDPYVIACG